MHDNQHKIILSYSALETFNGCERRFQQRKLLENDVEREESSALSNGRAVDVGYATYLETRDIDRAIFEGWMNYWPVLEDNIRSQAKAVYAIEALAETTPEHWELMRSAAEKPLTQASFVIKCGEHFDYVGYIDAIVRDTHSGKIIPLEVKTTSATVHPSLLYANSVQALVYAFIVYAEHEVIPTDIDYTYMVARMPRAKSKLPTAEIYEEHKTIVDVLQWLITLKLDIQRIEQLMQLNFFPKRNNCGAFGKQCPYFSVCDITSNARTEYTEINYAEYDYVFELDELIALAMKAKEEFVK